MGSRDTVRNPAWDAPQQRMAPPVDDRPPLGPVQLLKGGEREPRQGALTEGKKKQKINLHIFTCFHLELILVYILIPWRDACHRRVVSNGRFVGPHRIIRESLLRSSAWAPRQSQEGFIAVLM